MNVYIIIGDTWVEYDGGQTWIAGVFHNRLDAKEYLKKLEDLIDDYFERKKAKRKVERTRSAVWQEILLLDKFAQCWDDNLRYSLEEHELQ